MKLVDGKIYVINEHAEFHIYGDRLKDTNF